MLATVVTRCNAVMGSMVVFREQPSKIRNKAATFFQSSLPFTALRCHCQARIGFKDAKILPILTYVLKLERNLSTTIAKK